MNLGDIRTRVQRTFGDTSEAQIETDDIDRWANDAQTDIIRLTERLQDSTDLSAVAGQENYALPADFMWARRATFDGHTIKHLSMEELDNFAANRDEDQPTGTPRFFWVWANDMYLYPRPSNSDTDNIKILYVRRAATLDDAADIPEIPLAMHEDIVRYCLMRAYELNEDWGAARQVEIDYQNRMAQARYETSWAHTDTYPAVRLVAGDEG